MYEKYMSYNKLLRVQPAVKLWSIYVPGQEVIKPAPGFL
jgi:hypothetical protein